jgi:hypothetical protein
MLTGRPVGVLRRTPAGASVGTTVAGSSVTCSFSGRVEQCCRSPMVRSFGLTPRELNSMVECYATTGFEHVLTYWTWNIEGGHWQPTIH